MQNDTEGFERRQAKRRRRVNKDVAIALFGVVLTVVFVLWMRWRFIPKESIWSIILLVVAIGNMMLMIPILIVRYQRMREIAGGEEDEARNY